MKPITVLSVYFNFPTQYRPIYFDKLQNELQDTKFDILRYWDEDYGIGNESYYFKFTFYRIYKFIDYLKKNVLNKYKYFLLTDATDVAYVGNFLSWESILQYYDSNIVFGAEKFLWPTTEYSHLYRSKNITTEFKYLNAGVVLAETAAYIEHLHNIIERNLVGLCDQGNWQIEYLLNEGIEIDYDSKLVLNTFNAKDSVKLENNTVEFLNTTPLFVHDNGGYNENTVKLTGYFL